VVIQPPWHLPHSFERLSAGVPIAQTPYVMSYGLTITELCRAESLVDARLLDRVGLPWLVDLDDEIAYAGSPLAAALRDLGISGPGQISSERVLPSAGATPVPAAEMWNSLAGATNQRVHEFIQNELAVFAEDLETNAPGGRPSDSLQRAAERLLDIYSVRFRPRRFHDRLTGEKQTWGLDYERMLERIALELRWLYADRPKLRRCVLCDAIFVTTTTRANCSWTLWNAVTGEEIQRCAPADVFASFDRRTLELKHQRNRKRLNETLRRARQAAGGDENDPRVRRALKSRDDYMREHGRRRGPASRVERDDRELVAS
jgi:hypothetical protein